MSGRNLWIPAFAGMTVLPVWSDNRKALERV